MKIVTSWIAIVATVPLYVGMVYGLNRTDTTSLQLVYALLFGIFLWLYWQRYLIGWKKLLILGFLIRLCLLPHIPSLSDDFYRFIFDGQLILQGINPYAMLPVEAGLLVDESSRSYMQLLVEKMNSPNYYSIYPPLHQVFFALSALAGKHLFWNVFLLRLPLLFAELSIATLLYKLLPLWNQERPKLLLYWLNPLVILEITGNLHFEAYVLLGILGSLWFFKLSKPMLSAGFWSFAIGIKLVPAILGATWLRAHPPIKEWRFWISAVIFCTIFLFPLSIAPNSYHFYQSFRLYQSTFEFNASIYYFLRFLNSFWLDYNPIQFLGPALNLIAVMVILLFTRFQARPFDLAKGFVWTYICYLLFQTTVHPWYIIPMLGVSMLTNFKFPLLWSALIFLSYTAYNTSPVQETLAVMLVQYIPLLTFVFGNIRNEWVLTSKNV